MDVIFLRKKEVLHVEDTAAHFFATTFLDTHGAEFGGSVDSTWILLVINWGLKYTEYQSRLCTDQGSVFRSERKKKLADLNGTQLHLSEIDSHSSLERGERYHERLRGIYRKLKCTHPQVPPFYLLKTAIMLICDIMGENELVPFCILFGIIPIFSTFKHRFIHSK